MNRKFYAFESVKHDGNRSTIDIHNFTSKAARDAWVAEDAAPAKARYEQAKADQADNIHAVEVRNANMQTFPGEWMGLYDTLYASHYVARWAVTAKVAAANALNPW